MRRRMLFICIVAAIVAIPFLLAAADPPKQARAALMQRKLQAAQKVLEGIAINDFGKISSSAEELKDIRRQVEWKVLNSAQYELHGNDFARHAESLIEAAKAKNIDAAALAYVELTLSCVKCHKYVRETRMTDLGSIRDALARR